MTIKPCPLCASSAKTFRFALVFWGVRCTGCMLYLKDMNTSEQSAINQWDSRITPEERALARSKKKGKKEAT